MHETSTTTPFPQTTLERDGGEGAGQCCEMATLPIPVFYFYFLFSNPSIAIFVRYQYHQPPTGKVTPCKDPEIDGQTESTRRAAMCSSKTEGRNNPLLSPRFGGVGQHFELVHRGHGWLEELVGPLTAELYKAAANDPLCMCRSASYFRDACWCCEEEVANCHPTGSRQRDRARCTYRTPPGTCGNLVSLSRRGESSRGKCSIHLALSNIC